MSVISLLAILALLILSAVTIFALLSKERTDRMKNRAVHRKSTPADDAPHP